MSSKVTETDYKELVGDIARVIDNSSKYFSAWEIDFAESLDGKETFTASQKEKIDELWEKATSVESGDRD